MPQDGRKTRRGQRKQDVKKHNCGLRSGFPLTFERKARRNPNSFLIHFGGWATPLCDALWIGPPGTPARIRVPYAKPISQRGNDLIPIKLREVGAVVIPHQR